MEGKMKKWNDSKMWVTLVPVLLVGAGFVGGNIATTTQPSPKEVAERSEYYFDWLENAPHAPVFYVRDTESSLGPYARKAKLITMEDLIKMHGHPCDGLVTAACGVSLGLNELYPDGVIDRTDTACITNNSPCFGDVAAYLTGGRIRFGSQKIDPKMGIEFILYRMSTGRAVRVAIKDGVFPADVSGLEKKIKAGDFTEQEMRLCQKRQWEYARDLVCRPLDRSFLVEELKGFHWQPDPYVHLGGRGDVVNKDFCNKH
jgi:formylmethanofuran dehydrogenase subunit E